MKLRRIAISATAVAAIEAANQKRNAQFALITERSTFINRKQRHGSSYAEAVRAWDVFVKQRDTQAA